MRHKTTFEITADFTSNAYTAMADELADAGLNASDIVSITRLGFHPVTGHDEFEVVFESERAAREAVAHYSCEDTDSDFVTESIEAA